MKKIVSLVIAVSMVLSIFATSFAAIGGTFSDLVGDNYKYAAAVAALSELKVGGQPVIQGYPDGTFGPLKEVSRAEMAKIFVVCSGLGDEVEALASKTVFSDVPASHWASGWINAAAQSKIIVGYPDGTFQPEKPVSYAEAFTMAIRALGYGNVADFEGTWPTSYMLKAVELKLTRDMEDIKSDGAAIRGNVAILVWNMLRTPMWRVTAESENDGMTLSNNNRQRMLNVKFPDYTYVEDVYVEDIYVTDAEDVALTINDEGARGDGQISGVDISRVIYGEKVTALVKDGKKGEDPTFLTLTPMNTIVEGVVTKVKDDKFTVNGTEYKMDLEKADGPELEVNDYVVFEADGKKVAIYEEEVYVIKILPVGGTVVEDQKSALRKIKEDELVLRDGVWADREDIEEGDVYTEMRDWDGNHYWQVASADSRISGSFDSYTTEKVDGETSYFVDVDGESYRNVIGNDLKVWEGEKNNKKVQLADLQQKEKDNKYLDKDVEVAVDYLGNPVAVYFGEVDDLNNGGSFYAVANGVWETSGKGGSTRNIALVGFDGEGASEDDISEGVDYTMKKNAEVPEGLDQDDLLQADSTPVFVWANFDSDGETIKTILPLEDGMTSGDPEGYKSKWTIVGLESGEEVDDGKLAGFKVTAASVMVVTPLKDEDEIVEGYAVEIREGLEDGDKVTEGSFLAYDASKKVQKAAFVFLAAEPESNEWLFGKVETYDESSKRGIKYVTINGEEMELDEDSPITDFEEGDVVAYTIYKEKAKVQKVFATTVIDDALIIDDETESEVMVFTEAGDPQYDLDEDSDDVKDFKKYKVVEIGVGTEDDDETLVFEDAEELSERGLLAVDNTAGNRVLVSEDEGHKYILVFKGLKVEEKTSGGKLVDEA